MATTTGKATEFITFSRTSNATVTDSDGKIKWAPHNLLLASEQFDSASWTKTSTTPTANAVAAPNGTTTADTLTASGANGTTLQTFTAEAISYTFGVWLKRKTGTGNIQIAADSGTYTTVTITSDWALYTVTQTPTAGSKSAGIRIVTSADAVEAWGAHLYRSDLGGMKSNTSAYPTYNPTTPKNLLGFTEDFTNAAWNKVTSTTITANQAVSPNGLNSADLLDEGTANGYHHVVHAATTVANGIYTLSFYAKYVSCRWANVSLYSSGNTTSYSAATFDLLNGTVGTSSASGTGYAIVGTPTITPVGSSGWYRCALTVTNGSSFPAGFFAVSPSNVSSISSYGLNSYTGTNQQFYLWGAQLSDSASLDAYVPNNGAAPTAAAYYGPRLDADPVTLAAKGLLVEEARTNLLLRSAEFDNATYWSLNSCTIAANAGTAPDGSSSADKVVSAAATASTGPAQSITSTTVAHTFSIYAKAAGATFIQLLWNGPTSSNYANFDLSLGTLTAGTYTDAKITPVGNSWYRISITSTSASTTITANAWLIDNGTVARGASFTGDGTKGVLVWGAQLELGSFATSYIPTGAATATRNADVASVDTNQFPYSATEGTLVVAWQLAQLSGSPAALHLTDAAESNRIRINAHLSGLTRSTITAAGVVVDNIDTATAATGITKYAIGGASANYAVYRNGSAGGTSTNSGFPSGCTEMRIGRDGASGNFNGHIRQITYIPRRLTNAELQARTT